MVLGEINYNTFTLLLKNKFLFNNEEKKNINLKEYLLSEIKDELNDFDYDCTYQKYTDECILNLALLCFLRNLEGKRYLRSMNNEFDRDNMITEIKEDFAIMFFDWLK